MVDGFDFPIGIPNAEPKVGPERWYICQDFLQEVNPDCTNPRDGDHLGEDWNKADGDCSKEVYAAANGEVIVAKDYGGAWGGVVIIRHTMPDDTTQFESLYAHLLSFSVDERDPSLPDPPPPQVVMRSDEVGKIGNPLPCHLHFEIRDQNCPDWGEPGYGYYLAGGYADATGWVDPSDFITEHRTVTLTHRDAVSLSFGTSDGGFLLSEEPGGSPVLVTRNVVDDVSAFSSAPPLPGSGSTLATVAGDYLIALVAGAIYAAPVADVTSTGGWQVVGTAPADFGINQLLFYSGYLYALGRDTSPEYPAHAGHAAPVRHDGTLGDWFFVGGLPQSARGAAAVFSDGYLFFTGGSSTGNNLEAKNQVYSSPIHADGRFAAWTELTPMPHAKHRHACAVNSGHLFVVAGLTTSGKTNRCYSALINADGTIGSWTRTADMTANTWDFPVVSVSNALLIVGGQRFASHYSGQYSTAEVMMCAVNPDGTASPWSQIATASSASQHAAVVVGETIVQLGGWYVQLGVGGTPRDGVSYGDIVSGPGSVTSARYSHDFTLPSNADDVKLSWDASVNPGSLLEFRYRVGDPSTGTYSIWSDWFSTQPLSIVGTTNRVGYEARATVVPGDQVQLYAVEISYRNSEPGTTPVGIQLPVNLGTGLMCIYDEVTAPGVTTQTPEPNPPSLPAGVDLITSFDLSTSATFTGLVQLAFDMRGLFEPGAAVDLLHYVSGSWEVATSFFDDVNGVLYGWVSSLSPFAVVRESAPTGIPYRPTVVADALHQNYPNPFNPTTTIRFDLAEDIGVVVQVFDVSGRLVRTLVNAQKPAGTYTIPWDGRDNRGDPVASGVYFYRLKAGSYTNAKKMLLLQ